MELPSKKPRITESNHQSVTVAQHPSQNNKTKKPMYNLSLPKKTSSSIFISYIVVNNNDIIKSIPYQDVLDGNSTGSSHTLSDKKDSGEQELLHNMPCANGKPEKQ